jgi:hypothetical protein
MMWLVGAGRGRGRVRGAGAAVGPVVRLAQGQDGQGAPGTGSRKPPLRSQAAPRVPGIPSSCHGLVDPCFSITRLTNHAGIHGLGPCGLVRA